MIRRATPGDAAAVAALVTRVWQRDYADLADPSVAPPALDGEILVHELGGEVHGVAAARPGVLVGLFVGPVAQGAGVGTALAEAIAAEHGPDAEATVLRDDERARAFLERRGWRHDGAEPRVGPYAPTVRYVRGAVG